ncbi:hypothetical protein L914_07108, partial [Phytophthora nicotianae]
PTIAARWRLIDTQIARADFSLLICLLVLWGVHRAPSYEGKPIGGFYRMLFHLDLNTVAVLCHTEAVAVFWDDRRSSTDLRDAHSSDDCGLDKLHCGYCFVGVVGWGARLRRVVLPQVKSENERSSRELTPLRKSDE